MERESSVEEALRSRSWLLDAMLRPFPIGTINVLDRDLRYLYATGADFERVGLSSDVVIGHRMGGLLPREGVAQVRPFYDRAFAGETVRFSVPALGREYSIPAWPLATQDGAINAIVALARETPTPPSAEALPPRLRQIAALIATGLTNQQIAGRLQLK